ncbi:Outer membrane receptor proteins, mostly Fe transport [Methylobacillus rhizosphaerae]|uniref:Outer membrane receptor proteins, mostly Fe transport n=2 Tax=Methylobacillus rhizosphaerae TaxID=551994 RepID=A0A238ZLX8_9PROT|nr:Outer membrane receptor proteins, mostly Fe transport [Methylobacillus rhizosphaerae]
MKRSKGDSRMENGMAKQTPHDGLKTASAGITAPAHINKGRAQANTLNPMPKVRKLHSALRNLYRRDHSSLVLLTASLASAMTFPLQAAELNTQLPTAKESSGSVVPMNIDIPSQPLSAALKQLAISTGISVSFDSNIATGKTAPAVKGRMSANDALKKLLAGSGLESEMEDGSAVVIAGMASPEDIDFKVDSVEVRAKRFYEIGPLGGTGLTKEQIPGNVQTLTAKDIQDAHALSMADLMNSRLQSVNVNDYQGNPFQMDVQYRGFTAGPQIGTPQGLSVFFDGIRVNEPFGDVVNWDMIPMNALASFDVFPGSNPIFGLGTLGGALSMKTKDGFNNTKVNAEVLTGSFGRRQLQAEGGWNNGTVAGFAAANIFLEDGWRDNSPSRVNQVFTKGSYRGDKLDLNLSTLVVWNDLTGNGMLPSEMYAQDRSSVFTSPDTTDNRLWQFQLSGSYFVNDNFSITGQAYRRNSKRKQKNADVYTEYDDSFVRRKLEEGEQYTCLFDGTNAYELPDYYVVDIPNNDISQSPFFMEFLMNGGDAAAALASAGVEKNATLTNTEQGADYVAYAASVFNNWKNWKQALMYEAQSDLTLPELEPAPVTDYTNWEQGSSANIYNTFNPNNISFSGGVLDPWSAFVSNYYYTPDGTKHLVLITAPTNLANCSSSYEESYKDILAVRDPTTGNPLMVDGANAVGGQQPGVVEGTPTAVITNTQINQVTDGASMQFNWNYEKHKFMVGASVDMPSATYKSGQMLGLFDAERDGYLDASQIRDQYAAASVEVSNANFKGHQVTKSIYASETWTPIETLSITGALRYNDTKGKNKIASRTYGSYVWDLAQFEALPDQYNLCINGECPTTGYKIPDLSRLQNKPETEKFSYYSLNPSLGATWQATPELNVYGNVSQGTRVPSVVELGCAFDHTLIEYPNGGDPYYVPRSLAENRACSLPTTLSGDPYLPQIKATTFDLGMRGRFNDNVEWNFGVYRTDLRDDIYMIGYPGNRNFFDTVGDTRRQGLEAGITAAFEKWRLRLNYALTEATFQDSFWMPANDNSSSVEEYFGNYSYSRRIQVKPGNRMPGVPLHNFNATLSYQITPKWQVGLTAVAHSFSFVRGNENNKHRQGEVIYDTIPYENRTVARQATSPGTTPGYLMLNFNTSYRLNSEWTLGLRVNNLLDKEYFTAGQLGRNPFSPSINGAIGPDGYNHNSNDWLMTNFLAPGAPRAAWISLSYSFDPRK